MEITWHGTAALVLREGEAAIAFDLFFGMPIGCFTDKKPLRAPEGALRGVTDVFVTHGHFDHIDHLPALCGMAPFQIHCTRAPERSLVRLGVPQGRITSITSGQTDRIPPFTVTAFQSRHCRFDLPVILKTVFRRRFFRHPVHLVRVLGKLLRYPEKGEILMYEVSCGGARIQILGSLGLDGNTDYPVGADVLILPYQGRSDLEKRGLEIVRRLGPRSVLLDHYDDAFPPISGDIDTEEFIKTLARQAHIPCRAMIKGRDIHVETEKALG